MHSMKDFTIKGKFSRTHPSHKTWQHCTYSVGQEIPNIEWNPKVHYRVNNSL